MVEMVKQVTKGMTIGVESFFQPEYSEPLKRAYRFAYRIKIENNNSFPIKILQREWSIIDSHSTHRNEIKEEGIGGIQPIIPPGESYSYASSANLNTGIGKIHGKFLIENQLDRIHFEVTIPEIIMIAPMKMN